MQRKHPRGSISCIHPDSRPSIREPARQAGAVMARFLYFFHLGNRIGSLTENNSLPYMSWAELSVLVTFSVWTTFTASQTKSITIILQADICIWNYNDDSTNAWYAVHFFHLPILLLGGSRRQPAPPPHHHPRRLLHIQHGKMDSGSGVEDRWLHIQYPIKAIKRVIEWHDISGTPFSLAPTQGPWWEREREKRAKCHCFWALYRGRTKRDDWRLKGALSLSSFLLSLVNILQ